jgi:hypothetical protein
MKEHNDDTHLKHLLQDKLEEHTVVAPDFVWPAIEKELFPPANKRRPFFWWFVFSGLILGVLSFYFLYPRNEINFNYHSPEIAVKENATNLNSLSTKIDKSELKSSKTSDGKSTKNVSNYQKNQNVSLSSPEKGNGKTAMIQSSYASTKNTNQKNRTKKTKKQKATEPISSLLLTNDFQNEKTADLGTIESENNNGEELNPLNSTDEISNLEIGLLAAKSLDHTAFSIPLVKTNLRYPRKFVPYSFIDFYAGRGRNSRNYSGEIETSKKALLVDRTLQFKNNNIGIDYNMQFCRFASFRVGYNMGTNRYTTRLFPIRIANVSLNDELDISSPSGDLKSAPLELDDQASPISDTTTFLMRIIHRSSYYSVPLSIRFNTTNIRGPQAYIYSGIDLNFRGTDKNTLVVRRSQIERIFTTSKPSNAQTLYPGWHLGLGLATNPIRRLQVYGEFHYSTLFSDYYKGKIISIQSSNYQINLGLRFKLVANHDTKRLIK